MPEMLQAISTFSNASGARAKGDPASGPEDASDFLQAFLPDEGPDSDPDAADAPMSLVEPAAAEVTNQERLPQAIAIAGTSAMPPGLAVADTSAGTNSLRGPLAATDSVGGVAFPEDGLAARGVTPGVPGAASDPGTTGKAAATATARAVLAALGGAPALADMADAGAAEDVVPELVVGRGGRSAPVRPDAQLPAMLPVPPSVAQQRVAGAMLEGVSIDIDVSRRLRPEVNQAAQTGGAAIPPALVWADRVQAIAPGHVAAADGQRILSANLSGLAMAAMDGLPGAGATVSLLPLGVVPPGLFADQPAMSQRVAAQIAQALSAGGNPSGVPVELALDPPELGRVRLNLTEVNGVYALTIAVERPETADLMRRHIALLADEFARAGLDAPSVNISQDGAGDRSASRDEPAVRIVAPLEGPDAGQPGPTVPQTPMRTSQGLDLRL